MGSGLLILLRSNYIVIKTGQIAKNFLVPNINKFHAGWAEKNVKKSTSNIRKDVDI